MHTSCRLLVEIWYRCLVSKIVILLKNSFTTVCSWKKKNSFCCLPTQIIEIWFHCLDIHSKLSQTLQLPTLQLSLLFSNAIHFTMNLQLWRLKRTSHPVKRFRCSLIVRKDGNLTDSTLRMNV